LPKKGEITRKIRILNAGESIRAPKTWWNKMIAVLKEEPKYNKFSTPRLQRIAGGIWRKEPKATKIKIIKEYQK